MTARFAGSRSVDERRRRRLAVETPADVPALRSPCAASSDLDAASSAPVPEHLPYRKFLSRRRWKHWALAVWGLGLGALLLMLGSDAGPDGRGEYVSAPWVGLFDLAIGRAVPVFVAGSFLLAGQLAVLVLWVRSRSLRDFEGRYRVWGWAAAGGILTGLVLAAGAHRAWGTAFVQQWPTDVWKLDVLAWLMPAFIFAGPVVGTLRRDMRGCRTSQLLLDLSCVGWMVAAAVALEIRLPLDEVSPQLAQSAAMVVSAVALALSMSLHARHVIYESVEPPMQPPSWLRRAASRIRLPRLRLRLRARRKEQTIADSAPRKPRTRRAADGKQTATNDAKPSEQNAAPMTPAHMTTQQEAPPASKRPSPQAAPPADELDEEDVPAPVVSGADAAEEESWDSESEPETSSESGRQLRIDEPIDSSALKGLSKRDRRKLRKQWRDQQRGGGNQ